MNSKDLEILFEDDHLLALNKPSGLASQATQKNQENLYDLLCQDGRWKYIGMHQRLDMPTSGVILFTKTKKVNEAIAEMFLQHEFEKVYLCLCKGIPNEDHFRVINFLRASKNRHGKKMVRSVASGGDEAITEFHVLEKFIFKTESGEKPYSLIEAKPGTGRMHQIRVHLNDNKNPILGDALYYRADRKFPRLMLHAYKLKFAHPLSKEAIEITADLPEDFHKALARFRPRS